MLLGTGADKGLLQLRRNQKGGVAFAKIGAKGGAAFRLGYIERFGTEPEPKQFCAASTLDDTIEIRLPAWADEQDV